ncbi:hypothetical protein [Streptomyces sp. NBC_00572]|uniref:hypothetical protein n=1 Tax=Streptomyces sp. NBC_00572 TaxID=2903664 RepID=UPI00225B553F|nr:hypothetical protein [Streptomyces sp. NBC_00572]MCX4984113.1 hypothetical protein [Streptomyces sp. NBC_00572]
MTRSENEVDQIVFRWDSENLTGSTGFGPVAWSGPRDEAEALFRTFGTVLRASGEETRPALVRLEGRSTVMLVRRSPFTDAGGGTSVFCHALVGSTELLQPAVCLGLHAWNWKGADVNATRVRGPLPVISEDVLVPATGRGQGELDGALEYASEELTGTVAEFLRHPEERFTVLDERGDTATPVLWGLHSMFGELTSRRWTFATHDTVELATLRFVFVGRWSGAASGNTGRRRIDPRERSGDPAEQVAARLVRHHLRGIEEGGDGLDAIGRALHEASSASAARRTSLLERATRALDVLDRRRTGGPTDGPTPRPRPEPPPPQPPSPQPPAGDPPQSTAGKLWAWASGGRAAEDSPPPETGPPAGRGGTPRDGEAPAAPAGPAPGELRAFDRPGPSDRPDVWFREDPPEKPREESRRPSAPQSDPYDHRPRSPELADPRSRPSRAPHHEPPAPGLSDDREAYGDHRHPSDAPHRADLSKRPSESGDGRSASPGDDDPGSRPEPQLPEGPGRPAAQAPSHHRPPQGPGADPYPRPVLPLAESVWTGPAVVRGRPWAKVRGRGREREVETGLVHKLAAADTVEEVRRLVAGGGDRELLAALRRPQAYLFLTLLLRETARRLPSWEHSLRRELCEVAIGREFWAVAPPGAEADTSDPPEEQRAANAAELYRWAVRPLLARGDAPVGTLAELLARLRTGPAPSARETFWLIVDGERPGLPEAVWLTLLKEAYGVPRTAPRPGAPAPGTAGGHPDDPGNAYTRRFLGGAGVLIGVLVVAILLIAVRGWFT